MWTSNLETNGVFMISIRSCSGLPVQMRDCHPEEYSKGPLRLFRDYSTSPMERTGSVQPGEEKAQWGISSVFHKYLKGGHKEDRARLFSVAPRDKIKDEGYKLKPRKLPLNVRKQQSPP